jgi:signal transduction histidine kinase
MPNGGSLSVTTRTDNGYAVIVVADSGKGMTEEFMRDRLFHPFATTKKKGIGLGLYSCRDIIEQHGGQIDVASKINAGTEFKIILPVLTEEQKIPEAEVAMV